MRHALRQVWATRNPASLNNFALAGTTRSGEDAADAEGTLAPGRIAVNARAVRFILE
jgi:hypothetical protein